MANSAQQKNKKIVDNYTKIMDMEMTNEIIANSKDMGDFAISKQTIQNIADWALNGASNTEIRNRLELNQNQWRLLLSICPTLVYVMRDSRELADMVIAGSLFQTAIGGKRVKKLQAKAITDYDDRGKPCGQHFETVEIWEELPPNPRLLEFLATHKLSEQFGKEKVDKSKEFRAMVDRFTAEERNLIELSKGSDVDADIEEKD